MGDWQGVRSNLRGGIDKNKKHPQLRVLLLYSNFLLALLYGRYDLREGIGVAHGHVRQHLAVDINAGLVKTVDESAV